MDKNLWLRILSVMLIVMIGIGGTTRLTRSGLSITEWRPISGILPPLSEQAWQEQFELYKKSPEFHQVNAHFELADYKRIFFWEYIHRLFGRLIFLFAAGVGAFLWWQKKLEGKIVVVLALLVAFQGLIGWLMVKSGLNKDPFVSPFMLALHFFSALFLLLVVSYHRQKLRQQLLVKRWGSAEQFFFSSFGILLGLQIFYGCLTSGFKAGFAFNTYPLMGGQFFPPGGGRLEPFVVNFFKNPAVIQWTHRWLGLLVLLFGGALFLLIRSKHEQLKGPLMHLFGTIFVQFLLGIATLVLLVPTWLAVTHQLVATLVVLAYFNIAFRLKIEPASPDRRL